MNQPSILVVEDDPEAVRLLRLSLEEHGYRVTAVAHGGEAEAATERERPDVVIIDLRLPDMDGFELLRRLRSSSLVPIIVITARHEAAVRLQCLRLGADDVLHKPFLHEELLLRIEGMLRRAAGGAPAAPRVYRYRGLMVDAAARRAELDGRELELTPTEQRLLEALARRPGVVHLADDLLARIWGPHAVGQYATLYLCISRLRKKLGDDGRQPTYLLTRARVGYLLPAAEVIPVAWGNASGM